jgi:hypothetical protein
MKTVVAALLSTLSVESHQLSPISRVVELLNGLAETAEKEGKKEEDLYETYVCWAKTVIDTKTHTNAEATTKIDELNAYIADLEAGRIELTTERVDLEKEIKDLNQDLEAMKAQRDQEHEDFLAAKLEMEATTEALHEAVDVMAEATSGHEEGEFIQGHDTETAGFAARSKESALLARAVELGHKFLTKGDAVFFQRLLTGEVPKADWKKLNRKATFKMKYKARSFHIQDVLKKMENTFNQNIEDAEANEQKALDDYTELKEAKMEQLATAEDALSKQDGENGAKAMSKEDAETERDALTTQRTNDEGFIEATANDLATKKGEWKDRQLLRAGEIEAINKAVSILHSDDARDMFKSSYKSQGFFLQVSASSKASSAGAVLASAAKRSGDKRMAALAKSLQTPNESMATGSHFDEVIAAIDDMVETLKSEEEIDLENKETCEKDRADDTRTAIKAARTMDERSDTIDGLKIDIAEIIKTIAANEAEIKSITEELDKAQTLRNDEHTEWEAANRDDGAAAELVDRAKGVLSDFYSDNGLVFVQKKKMEPVVAGEAPPPPPSTWEAPYGGKTGESQGIVAILEMIHEDILKDQAKGKADEDKAEETFQAFKTNSEQQISTLEGANTDLEDTKGQKEDDISTAKEQRGAKHDELNAVIAKINDATPSCVYNTINYPVRLENRQIEIDGLVKAKAILEGGEFPEDTSGREIKPGDAFLQRHKK